LEIANNRYRAGLVTFLEVVIAQSAELSLERSVAQLRGQKLVAAVGLIRAIGGGWEAQSAAGENPGTVAPR
jgi:outer membrane protein TolC